MTKNLSIISMLTMIFFITTAFTTSKLQSTITESDKFGFPFAFFQPGTESTLVSKPSFSLIGIVGDLAIWFSLAFVIVFIFSTFFKMEKNKATV